MCMQLSYENLTNTLATHRSAQYTAGFSYLWVSIEFFVLRERTGMHLFFVFSHTQFSHSSSISCKPYRLRPPSSCIATPSLSLPFPLSCWRSCKCRRRDRYCRLVSFLPQPLCKACAVASAAAASACQFSFSFISRYQTSESISRCVP